MTDEGTEENASALIKNVERLFVLAMINWSWSAISEQEVVCCYIAKFKGYILVYSLTCIYIQRKMFYLSYLSTERNIFQPRYEWMFAVLCTNVNLAGNRT